MTDTKRDWTKELLTIALVVAVGLASYYSAKSQENRDYQETTRLFREAAELAVETGRVNQQNVNSIVDFAIGWTYLNKRDRLEEPAKEASDE